ncbi:hypothetical protein AALP_AA2G191100 [Arabis alpina]|uniref:Uncharacterized protein n=1 Tax=Arabis alpina TaxID=50452 RepID=A0A087HII4_ARAAL|nr:hypothetical protein AALP_AA2G191100 [Arabis alpina]
MALLSVSSVRKYPLAILLLFSVTILFFLVAFMVLSIV